MPRKARNLLVFALICFFFIGFVPMGLYLPYTRSKSLTRPERSLPGPLPDGYQAVEFTSSDGLLLKGWYWPPQNGAVVVFVHGLGGNRTELLVDADLIAQAGYGALLFDLRNSGESDGQVTTLGLDETRDVAAAVAFVYQTAGTDAPVALFGHSMGGATVLLAAARLPEVRAVIAESAYSSIEENLNESIQGLTGLPPFPFAPLVVFFGQLDAGIDIRLVRPVDVVAQISPRPLLLIHGEQDQTILAENSRRLYAAAREPKELYLLPAAGHGGFLQAEPVEYPRRILAFLEKSLAP
jgi:alpha-beta hydrolase superfamily lysophospholipase